MSTTADPRPTDPPHIERLPGSFVVSSSNSRSPQSSTLAQSLESDLQYDLISFLGIAQRLEIDFLPIIWQRELGTVGEGGTANVSQSLVTLQTSLAFKRPKQSRQAWVDKYRIFRELISEILVLGHRSIRDHPNLIKLQGICWDIPLGGEKIWPVLVFEKSQYGDLGIFATSNAGKALCFVEKLQLCIDIGIAISDLHLCHITHGDIGPRNVLIFKQTPGRYFARVSDFGYSALVTGDGWILMPRTEPWVAPEWHHRGLRISEAMKMDMYSFGMLCLWLLFKDVERYPTRGTINELKLNDTLRILAQQLVMAVVGLDDERKNDLSSFFNLALTHDPNQRARDFQKLLQLLNKDGRVTSYIAESVEEEFLPTQTHFEIVESIHQLYLVDYRVRSHIVKCLKERVHSPPNKSCPDVRSQEAAYELALCYMIGFGVMRDENESQILLDQCKRQKEELERQISQLQDKTWYFRDGTFRRVLYEGHLNEFDFFKHYREHQQLGKVELEYRREIADVESVLGDADPIVTSLKLILSRILSDQGYWKKSEELSTEVMEIRKRLLGQGHPETLKSMTQLALNYSLQGRWKEAEELKVHVLEVEKAFLGEEHPSTLSSMLSLASTFRDQGRWKEAEQMEVRVVEARQKVLGQGHPATLTSMGNLACTYANQGRWKEAELLEELVMRTRKSVLGQEHPETLASMANLASTYGDQGRWGDAEELCKQLVEIKKKVLGKGHLDMLVSLANLSWIYGGRRQWKKAEEVLTQVVKMGKKILKSNHPWVLTGMSNLAFIYSKQGRQEEAEELLVQVVETKKKVLGQEHPSTLETMMGLAFNYRSQRQWNKVEELEAQILEIRRRVLGEEHPSTLKCMANLALTYTHRGRWANAEGLYIQVIETRKNKEPDVVDIGFLRSMVNLGSTIWHLGRWMEAKDMFVQVVETSSKVLGEEHPFTLTSMTNLASTLWNLGRQKEAEELDMKIMEKRKRTLGHLDQLASMANQALIYGDQGQWEIAEELLLRITKYARTALGLEHPTTLESMENLVLVYRNEGRRDEAEELEAQVTEVKKKSQEQEHLDIFLAMNKLYIR